MKNEYIIINKTAIQKRIDDLKKSLLISESNNDTIRAGIETFEIKQLEWCLSQSTPLIPEIEKAFDAGEKRGYEIPSFQMRGMPVNTENPTVKDYISNLKLDI